MPRILIVEDESIVALDMQSRLEAVGYEVIGPAASGPEAIEIAGTVLPDLVLMDIKLKGPMDGVEAAEAIRSSCDVPVIFITAFADDKTLERAKVTEAFGYILKPFQERELYITIEIALYKHRLEQQLKQSERWLDITIRSIADAVIATDQRGAVKFMNTAAESMLGLTEDHVGEPLEAIATFTDSAEQQTMPAADAQAPREQSVVARDGRELLIEKTEAPIADEAGNPVGSVVVFRDIAEKKRAQERLRRSETRFRAVVTASGEAMLACNNRLQITLFNPAAESLFGRLEEELLGESPQHLMEASDWRDLSSCIGQGDRETGSGGDPHIVEVRATRRDGSSFAAEVSISAVRSDAADAYFFVIRDISARKEYEQALQEAKLAAEEASRAKSEFLANMSHELRTPLNSILGMGDLALELADDKEQREYLQIIGQSAQSLLFLINSILDFSKIEAGRMELYDAPFNLPAMVEEAIDSLVVQAHKKDLDLAIVVEPDCPTGLSGDKRRLQQVLINLVGNAVKFTESGGVTIRVAPDDTPPDSPARVHFQVTDTGIGIAASRLPAVFEAFTQMDGSSTRAHGGTGLGLAISKRLVELMGGTIWVESTLGQGSTFHFMVPLELAQGAASSALYEHFPSGTDVHLRLFGPRNDTVRRRLESWGVATHTYASHQECLDGWMETWADSSSLCVLDASPLVQERVLQLAQDERSRQVLAKRLILVSRVGRKDEALLRRTCRGLQFLVQPIRERSLYEAVQGASVGRRATVPAPTAAEDDPAGGAVIAVAEDHAPSRMLIQQLLTKGGYRVRAAADGEELLSQIREQTPDVVLMDIQMPKMDGITATRLIRSGQVANVPSTVPIVAITAHALPGDQERFLSVGMDDYLAKPLTREQLFQVLARVRGTERSGVQSGTDASSKALEKQPETPPKTPAEVLHLLDELVAAVDALEKGSPSTECVPLAQRLRTMLSDLGATEASQNLFRLVLALRRHDTEKIDPLLQELSRALRDATREAVALSEREDS